MSSKLTWLSVVTVLSVLTFSTLAQSAFSGQTPVVSSELEVDHDIHIEKLSKQEKESVQKVMDEYLARIDHLRGEMSEIQVNPKISRAEKRQILPAFKPKIDNMISGYVEKLRPYSEKDKHGFRVIKAVKEMGEYHLYQLLDCPDNGAKMCI